jgi:hypothetical protein
MNLDILLLCDVDLRAGYVGLTIGSPEIRVEMFTLARRAPACIESTQFIIMT